MLRMNYLHPRKRLNANWVTIIYIHANIEQMFDQSQQQTHVERLHNSRLDRLWIYSLD